MTTGAVVMMVVTLVVVVGGFTVSIIRLQKISKRTDEEE